MTMQLIDIIHAVNKVERIHKIELQHVHLLFKQNEADVLKVFSTLKANTALDERFRLLSNAFPMLDQETPYLLEASIIVSK